MLFGKNSKLIHITDPDSFGINRQIIDDFFSLYEHEDNFPDPNEREPKENIIERVASGSMMPKTLLLIRVEDKKVIGGLIAEYYSKSKCFLLTYIFVKKSYRNKKVAFDLINSPEGVRKLIEHIENQYKEKVNAVFFETNNPFKTEKDSALRDFTWVI